MAKGVDFIDIPELHRRKVIKLPESNHEKVNLTTDGFFDFSQNQKSNQEENVKINQTTQEQTIQKQESPISNFFSDFASIGVSNNTQPEAKPENQNIDSESIKDLKWRIENLEYKLEQLTEKLNSLKNQ